MNSQCLQDAWDHVRERLPGAAPEAAMILGSGWSAIADAFTMIASIPYADIPCLGATHVQGHAGVLRLAEYARRRFLIFQGRRHWYEGVGWDAVALPVFIARSAGAKTLVLTNAAGGIRASLQPGTLMLVEDHINAMGANPLVGTHDPFWGPRFPDLSMVYDRPLRQLMQATATELGEKLQSGVYLAAAGPTYETPAEIRSFQTMGADAVGMSTVPEATLAHAAGMRVLALSCITNGAAGTTLHALSHDEVIAATTAARPRMTELLTRFMMRLLEQGT